MSELLVKPPRRQPAVSMHVTPETRAGPMSASTCRTGCKPGEMPPRAADGDRETCLVFSRLAAARVARRRHEDFGELGAAHVARSRASRGRSMCRPAWTGRSTATTDAGARRLLGAGHRRAARRASSPRTIRPGVARQGHQYAPRHQHPARDGEPAEIAAGGRGHHARRQHVVAIRRTSTTRTDLPRESPAWRRPTITGSTRRRALPSSASTPMTARSTRRWRWRTAT